MAASELNESSAGGDAEFAARLEACAPGLRRLMALRMDAKLRARLDPLDVLQETYAEAARRYAAWSSAKDMPFERWLRFLALQQLALAHRRHLGVAARSAERETPFDAIAAPSDTFAASLADSITSPSQGAVRAEERERVRRALEQLSLEDREVLELRHVDGLDNSEIAPLLGLTVSGASRRYLRAVARLRELLVSR